MAKFFSEQKWRDAAQRPDGYLQIVEEYKDLMKQAEDADKDTMKNIKEEVYSFIEELLETDQFYLAGEGYDFDAERQSVDTAVIHHIGGHPGMKLSRLNALGFMRMYAYYYAYPIESKKHLQRKPIYSGHFKDGKQVFFTYHWLVRRDGKVERLLQDDEIGWQAGDWNMNCRSVAICFDDTLTKKEPTREALEAVADIIKANYKELEILGHREINPRTDCPGELFLSKWKQELTEKVS